MKRTEYVWEWYDFCNFSSWKNHPNISITAYGMICIIGIFNYNDNTTTITKAES